MPKKAKILDPIAIVGIGCRFPGGADGPDKYWRLMHDGVDAIGEVPPDRFSIASFYDPEPGKPGKTYSKWGGFISHVDRFDPAPFGMTPREAQSVDPQQRLILEASWEALDDAGIQVNPAHSTSMGVFVGISTLDYPILQSIGIEFAEPDPYAPTGTTLSIAANRISYSFNFTGPSMIVDTACSSALVALNQACRALWSGECEAAIAGGVNAILLPIPYIAFCSINMLSPDGRCKAFDSRANGFVRGEGAGAVILKPLSIAQADGDRIYAVIRGVGVNQDGRTTGMTVPSQISQENLVRQVCRNAGIDPKTVQYMEAHGTGTAVGDPIEATALGNVLGAGRSVEASCRIGSVKTNIGHLEAGSGIAGLIKAALTLHHGLIPPSLHFENPNPNIDFEALRLRVVTEVEPYGPGPRLAGVNSFGFGGTNAFTLLENAPESNGKKSKSIRASASSNGAAKKAVASQSQLLVLSAKNETALKAMAEKWTAFLRETDAAIEDLAFSAATRRSHLDERIAAVGSSKEELATLLTAFVKGEKAPLLVQGRSEEKHEIAFVFSGQGPQWWAMGRELWEHEPVFHNKIEECHQALLDVGGWLLKGELLADEKKSRLSETEFAQPAITAIQIALAALWESWGIRPAAVVGHSVGEVAAAHVAGVFSLRDAMRVIYHRGRCMEHAPERGKMIAAALSAANALKLIEPYGEKLSLAAINSPTSVSISGDSTAVEEVAKQIEARGVFMRFVPVNYAFHSAQMNPVKKELLASLKGLRPKKAKLPLYSTVMGELAQGTEFNADYWWRNVRQTVNFAPAIEKMMVAGHKFFLEIAAHPVLSTSINECLGSGHKGRVLPSLRRQAPERATMLGSLGALHALGVPIRWEQVFPAEARYVSLPGYPWQREAFWREPATARDWRIGHSEHPLLTYRHRDPEMAWQGQVDRRLIGWINDHRVQGHMVFPAAGYIELGFSTARELHGMGPIQLEDIEFSKALFIPSGSESPTAQIVHDPTDNAFRVHSRSGGIANAWNLHAAGKHRLVPDRIAATSESPDAIRARCTANLGGEAFYDYVRILGLHFGAGFQGVRQVWYGPDEALGEIILPERLANEAGRYAFHPAQLDACLQVGAAALLHRSENAEKRLLLPVFLDRARLFHKPGQRLWSHVKVVRAGLHSVLFDIVVADDSGATVAEFRGLQVQAVEGTRSSSRTALEELCYEQEWQLAPLSRRSAISAAGTFLPDHLEWTGRLQKRALEEQENLGWRRGLPDVSGDLNALCSAYIRQAFHELGWRLKPGDRLIASRLFDEMKLHARYRFMLSRLLGMLAEDGYLRRGEGTDEWIVEETYLPRGEAADQAVLAWKEIDEHWCRLLNRFPSLLPELTLLDRCGRKLAGILRGENDAIQSMVPQGSLNTLEHLYSDSGLCRIHNTLVREALAEVAKRLPEGRVLRILEIGAGTGGLTGFVLPILPRTQVEYVFTDVSKVFFGRAEQRFRDFSFVKYEVLDIENDPLAQNFSPHSFDVVLASNVLHATVDLRQSLRHIRQLLAKDGLLAVLEVEVPGRLIDLTFGLSEGWWRFNDHDLRPEYPLLTRERWLTTLSELGFRDPAVLSDTANREEFQQITLLARGGGDEIATAERNGFAAHEDASKSATTWLIFEDKGGIARDLGKRLKERGHATFFVKPGKAFERLGENEFAVDPLRLESMKQLIETLGAEPPSAVIYGWGLNISGVDFATADLAQAESLTCYGTLHLVQALNGSGWQSLPRLWLITSAAQPVGAQLEKLNLGQSPLIGLGRTLANEHAQFRSRMVDLSPEKSDVELDALVEEFLSDEKEEEIVLRGEARYLQRLVRRADRLARLTKPQVSATQTPCRLEVPRAGAIDNIAFRPLARRQPAAGEVEIEIHAAGLNFRDVMKALGIYPAEAGDAMLLGDECAGTIVAVGEGVTEFKPGDAVMAIGAGCFGSHLTTSAAFVIHKPAAISFEGAATMLSTHMTAYYALHYLGRIKQGEKVLVHAAAGGVGLAAVQLAHAVGAEVFATAGSPEKRELLRLLGVKHVMDSRSLAFADEILDVTQGRGVDLVLNSIAGEAIAKSLSVLGAGGRFLEIGKRDIYGNTRIGLRPFKNNLSYFAIDLSKVMDPAIIKPFLSELKQLFAEGKLRPLPYRSFPLGDAVEAFRYMTQAKQIGKVVLSIHQASVPLDLSPHEVPVRFKAEATYLITGGVGGFGLAVASWLVEHGARHVVLASRSAAPDDEAQKIITVMESAGAKVVLAKCDIGKEEDLARVLAEIDADLPPLKGVFHSAMVLDDGVLMQLNAERFRRVMAPKADGAWNLHRLTRRLSLDHFVLFSSSSATMGNPGQGNYCAANLFLDTLAHHRHRLGLPALTVNWGLLAQVGTITRDPRLAEHFRRSGLEGLPTRMALDALGFLLVHDAVQTTVWDIDWNRWLQSGGKAGQAMRFSLLTANVAMKENEEDIGQHIRTALAGGNAESRHAIVQDYLRQQVGEVLRVAPSKLELERPLNEQGMDSLMAVELMHRIESQIGVSLPPAKLMGRPTIVKMGESLLEALGIKAEAPSAAQPVSSTPEVNLEAEIRLPKPFPSGAEPFDSRRAGRLENILLTSPLDMLGLHLIADLLEQTSARIHCLVQEADLDRAHALIVQKLQERGFEIEESHRIVPIAGDISAKQFGWGDHAFAEFSGVIDTIFHNAARVNHIAAYADLKDVTVGGTLEVIRFAAHTRIKPIHYLSSISIFPACLSDENHVALESDPMEGSKRLIGGYAQSRWVAEKCLRLAEKRGVPATIYRPGLMIGDSKGRISTTDDFVWRLLRTCLDLGCGPAGGFNLFITPVDFVSRAMVHCAQQPQSAGQNYHAVNPQPHTLSDMLNQAVSAGYPVEIVPWNDWEDRLRKNSSLKDILLILPYFIFTPGEEFQKLSASSGTGRVDSAQMQQILAGTGITCLDLTQELMDGYLHDLAKQGFLKKPSSDSSKARKSAGRENPLQEVSS